MTDTVLTNKQLTEPTVGSDLNTWGDILNTNLVNTDNAFGGFNNFTDVGGTVNLVPSQYIPPNWIITGTLTSNVNYRLPSGVGGMWSVYNAITNPQDNFTVTVSSAGSPGTAATVLPPSYRSLIVSDGAGNVQFAADGPQAQGFVTVSAPNITSPGDPDFKATADCFWTLANGLVTLRIGTLTGTIIGSDPFIITGFPTAVQPARNETCIVQIQTADAPHAGQFTMFNSPFQAVLTYEANDLTGICGLYGGNTIIYPLDTNIYVP